MGFLIHTPGACVHLERRRESYRIHSTVPNDHVFVYPSDFGHGVELDREAIHDIVKHFTEDPDAREWLDSGGIEDQRREERRKAALFAIEGAE